LRLFAPFVPYVTEEVWSWHFAKGGESIHTAPWPTVEELKAAGGDPAVFESAVAVLGQIRRYKTEARVSLRSPLVKITVEGPAAMLEKLCSALNDVLKAGVVAQAEFRPSVSAPLKVHVHTA